MGKIDLSTNNAARLVLGHAFIILVEVALLSVQYFRMEALAFDVLPDLADIDLGFMYGSHLMGIIWLLVVILVSYVTWELIIRVHDTPNPSKVLWASVAFVCMVNVGAMVFEFVLFRMLVEDFNSQFANAAELFGILMVITHQMASFWLMKNVIRVLFLQDGGEVS